MEKVCGKCSKEQGMTKEERIGLAMSRLPNTVYNCPICKDDFSFHANVTKRVIPVESPKKLVEKAKTTTKAVQEQLQLF
ncbi:MAG: hypothetical protein ACQEWV_27795 [Bacillota bacterium]